MTAGVGSPRAFLRWIGDWIYSVLIGFGRDDGADEEEEAKPR